MGANMIEALHPYCITPQPYMSVAALRVAIMSNFREGDVSSFAGMKHEEVQGKSDRNEDK